MQRDLSPYEYSTEVLAEFVEGSSTFFSPELVMRCTQRYDFQSAPVDQQPIYAGIDIGRYKDASVLVFIRQAPDGTFKMVYAKEILNTPLTTQVHIIQRECELWRPKLVCIESNGLSIHTVEVLKKTDLPILPFQPSIETKQAAFTHLLKLMEQDKIVIPLHNRLQFQLRNFMYEVTATGKLKLHHSTEVVGDDWPDALAFACWAAKKKGAYVPLWR